MRIFLKWLWISIVFLAFMALSIDYTFAEVFEISRAHVNIRKQPTTSSEIIGKAHQSEWFVYLGSSSDNKWRHIELPNGENGWIYYTLGKVKDDYTSILEELFKIKKLEIHIINVHQGDSTLIIAEGKNGEKASLLFDAGRPTKGDNFVVPYLKSIGISKLKYVIASHHDGDHIGGFDEVLRFKPDSTNYQITLTGKAYQPEGTPRASQKDEYEEYIQAVKEAINQEVQTLNPPEFIDLAVGMTLQVVTGSGRYIDKTTGKVIDLAPKDDNAKSIGLLLTFNKFKFFVGGDLGGITKQKGIEDKVAPFLGDIDVLRLNHHGSNTSTSLYFAQITKPEVALISCGNNTYGHPRKSVFQNLKNVNNDIDIYQTSEGDTKSRYHKLTTYDGKVSGNIVVRTDGDCFYSITGAGAEFAETKVYSNDDCGSFQNSVSLIGGQ